jgi:hypothetical protein
VPDYNFLLPVYCINWFQPHTVYIFHTISSLKLKSFEFHISSCYLSFSLTVAHSSLHIDRIHSAIYTAREILQSSYDVVGHDGHEFYQFCYIVRDSVLICELLNGLSDHRCLELVNKCSQSSDSSWCSIITCWLVRNSEIRDKVVRCQYIKARCNSNKR